MTLILLVYDHENEQAEVYAHCLRRADYHVKLVPSHDALEASQCLLPDLILCKALLPTVKTNLVNALNQQTESASIPRIAMDTLPLAGPEYVFEREFDDYLPMGVSCQELQAVIKGRLLRYDQMRADLRVRLRDYAARDEQDRQLFALLAHDLRDTFSGWVGVTDYLLAVQGEDMDAMLKLLSSAAHSGTHIFEQTLAYFLDTPQDLLLSATACFLREFMETTLDALAYKIQLQGIQIHLDIPVEFEVYAEQRVLFSVLYNVLDNACKVTPKNGVILCRLETNTEYSMLQIIDQGPGFPKSKLIPQKQTLQQGASYADVKKGWGAGLWLSEYLLRQMGGQLKIQNLPSRGACVTLYLPTQRTAPVS